MRIFLLTTLLLSGVNAFSHPGWGHTPEDDPTAHRVVKL